MLKSQGSIIQKSRLQIYSETYTLGLRMFYFSFLLELPTIAIAQLCTRSNCSDWFSLCFYNLPIFTFYLPFYFSYPLKSLCFRVLPHHCSRHQLSSALAGLGSFFWLISFVLFAQGNWLLLCAQSQLLLVNQSILHQTLL